MTPPSRCGPKQQHVIGECARTHTWLIDLLRWSAFWLAFCQRSNALPGETDLVRSANAQIAQLLPELELKSRGEVPLASHFLAVVREHGYRCAPFAQRSLHCRLKAARMGQADAQCWLGPAPEHAHFGQAAVLQGYPAAFGVYRTDSGRDTLAVALADGDDSIGSRTAAKASLSAEFKAAAPPRWRDRKGILLEQAAQGHVGSTVALCRLLHRVGERAQSAQLLETACALGNAWAMLATARRSLAASTKADPASLLRSEQKAWSLISRAAELGHDSAVCEVFNRLRQLHLDTGDRSPRQPRCRLATEDSLGSAGSASTRAVPIDETTKINVEKAAESEPEAERWFSLLATLALRGHIVAGYCGGLALKFGLGVPRNSERARILLGALARSGHREAKVALYGLEQQQHRQSLDQGYAFGLFALAQEVAPGASDPEADSDDYQRFLDDSVRAAKTKEEPECSGREGEEWRPLWLDVPSAATAAVAAAAAECQTISS
jgi:TPR repeat protein